MKVIINDGGRKAAGFTGMARGDCVARAIAIAAQLPYQEVYDALADINARTPASKRRKAHKVGRRTASDGIYTNSVLFRRYMTSLGFVWTATMGIGTGCKVHLRSGELPIGSADRPRHPPLLRRHRRRHPRHARLLAPWHPLRLRLLEGAMMLSRLQSYGGC